MTPLTPFLDVFVGYLHAERGLAARSVEAYAADLVEYLRGLQAEGVQSPGAITSAHVRRHLDALAARGLSTRSQARHLAALRVFHRFLAAEGHAREDPTALTDTPRLARRLPVVLSLEEVEALLDAPRDSSPSGVRTERCCRCCTPPGFG